MKHPLIPTGDYCYSLYPKMVCPFWSIRKDKPEQMNGYCSYLGRGDWEVDCFSLLWDQVKECDVNLYEEEDY